MFYLLNCISALTAALAETFAGGCELQRLPVAISLDEQRALQRTASSSEDVQHTITIRYPH